MNHVIGDWHLIVGALRVKSLRKSQEAFRHSAKMLLLVLALLARIIIPDGWMPHSAGYLTLCTPQGARVVPIEDGAPVKGEHHAATHPPCVFSATGVAASPPIAPLLLLAFGLLVLASFYARPQIVVSTAATRGRRRPRAPPSI